MPVCRISGVELIKYEPYLEIDSNEFILKGVVHPELFQYNLQDLMFILLQGIQNFKHINLNKYHTLSRFALIHMLAEGNDQALGSINFTSKSIIRAKLDKEILGKVLKNLVDTVTLYENLHIISVKCIKFYDPFCSTHFLDIVKEYMMVSESSGSTKFLDGNALLISICEITGRHYKVIESFLAIHAQEKKRIREPFSIYLEVELTRLIDVMTVDVFTSITSELVVKSYMPVTDVERAIYRVVKTSYKILQSHNDRLLRRAVRYSKVTAKEVNTSSQKLVINIQGNEPRKL